MLENESNAVNLLNDQVKSHNIENAQVTIPTTPTPIVDPNFKFSEPQVITRNKHKELVKKCCKTPLLYFTLVPIAVLLIFLLVRPSFIYNIDKATKKKKINTGKLFGSMIGIILATDAFIYFYIIKHCKYNI